MPFDIIVAINNITIQLRHRRNVRTAINQFILNKWNCDCHYNNIVFININININNYSNYTIISQFHNYRHQIIITIKWNGAHLKWQFYTFLSTSKKSLTIINLQKKNIFFFGPAVMRPIQNRHFWCDDLISIWTAAPSIYLIV